MKTNDKVVCVDDSHGRWFDEYTFPNGMIAKDQVYVIESFVPSGTRLDGVLIDFDGVFILGKHAIAYNGFDCPYRASRFRLVSEVGHPPIAIEQPQPLHA